MTYREKLKKEHPDKIDPTCGGGCQFCPHTYWPEAEAGDKLYCENGSSTGCDKCWDREIPESKKAIGYIQFEDGITCKIVEFEILENSTDCLTVKFKSEKGAWYLFKKYTRSNKAIFAGLIFGCICTPCSIKHARINDCTNHTSIVMDRNDEPSLYPKSTLTPCEIEYMKRDLQLTKDALAAIKKNYVAEKKRNKLPQIKNVIFNNPATIVFWDDGSKTVVKANGEDAFVPEVGLAMAISKKALGNGSSYFDEFKKWCKDEPVKSAKKDNIEESYRKSVIRTYLNTANEKISLVLGKTRTTPLDEDTIDKLSDAQLYLSTLSSYVENNIEEGIYTLIKGKITEARAVLENVAFYTNKPLKKDLEKAIDEALCALMDISEMEG